MDRVAASDEFAEEVARETRLRQVAAFIRNLPLAAAMTAFNAIACGLLLSVDGDRPWVWVWVAVFLAGSAYQAAQWRRNRHRPPPTSVSKRTPRRAAAIAVASGIFWGVFAAVHIVDATVTQMVGLAVVVTGMAAGSVFALYRLPAAALGFAFPCLTPPLIVFAASQGPNAYPVIITYVLYAIYLSVACKQAHAVFTTRVRKEVENRHLLVQAQAANRAKSLFIAAMNHELRTPLNAVIGYADVLRSNKTQTHVSLRDDQELEYLNYIHDSGTHLLSLVNELITAGELGTGRFRLDRAPFDAREPARFCERLLAAAAASNRQSLTLHLPDEPMEVNADRRVVLQILINLVGNALKFTPTGGAVSLELRRDARDALVYTVRDTGVGIDPKRIALLFEPFYQVDRDLSTDSSGVGLGLYIVHSLCKAHDASLDIDSEPGRGTTVVVTFGAEA